MVCKQRFCYPRHKKQKKKKKHKKQKKQRFVVLFHLPSFGPSIQEQRIHIFMA
jgi:hypothetical protein